MATRFTTLSDLVRNEGRSLSPSELLAKSVTKLQGESSPAQNELKRIHVQTVFDLAISFLYHQAKRIVEATKGHLELRLKSLLQRRAV